MAVGAGDEGAEPLDAVDEAVGDEEVERPVDDRRLAPQPRRRQPVEELVGGQRPMRLEQRLEHEGPRRRQPQPPRRAHRLDRRQRLAPATAVVMRREGALADGLTLACVTV